MNLNPVALLLVALILLGVLSNNNSITISSAILLLMQQTFLAKYLPFMAKNGVNIGIIILTIGVLAPIVLGKVALPNLMDFLSWKMFLSIAIGMLVAWFAGRGVTLMTHRPLMVTGLLLGTILGVAFLRGIPVGPLIAAGILSLFIGKGL